MLKPVRKKRKTFGAITDEFNKKESCFKNTAESFNLKELALISINKINELTNIPSEGEHIRIVTRKAINSFDFILAITNNEDIQELTLSTYRIGKKVVNQLIELQKIDKIDKINILINDGFPKLVPDCWNLIKSFESEKWIIKLENNHTKILLIDTIKNKYIVEGSGNMSINARIEQYCFDNSEQIYNFHYNWINKI